LRITRSGEGLSGILTDGLLDNIKKVFQFALIATALMFGYLLYGLVSGGFADAAMKPEESRHALELVNSVSTWVSVSLVLTLLCGILLYYEETVFGFVLLGVSAVLMYGLQFAILVFGPDAKQFTTGGPAQMFLHQMLLMSMMIGAPGVLLVLRTMGARFLEARQGEDLTSMQYGANVQKEDVPRALLPILAKCWQLPFCRAGIRENCPIFLAKTKCWKERVGCMCEENIILLSMGGSEKQQPVNITKEMGFVAIGDILTKGNEEKRANIQTRVGPRGVKIPTNPHVTEVQKRERCRNCIIYNEHQRVKYSFFSVPVTLMVPVIVVWQFEAMRMGLAGLLHGIDSLIRHISINGTTDVDFSRQITGSVPIEAIIIFCLTLVVMTWAQRFLEYCIFKLKI
jgi:hypothetical protein